MANDKKQLTLRGCLVPLIFAFLFSSCAWCSLFKVVPAVIGLLQSSYDKVHGDAPEILDYLENHWADVAGPGNKFISLSDVVRAEADPHNRESVTTLEKVQQDFMALCEEDNEYQFRGCVISPLSLQDFALRYAPEQQSVPDKR